MRIVQIQNLWKKSCKSLRSAKILLDHDSEEDARQTTNEAELFVNRIKEYLLTKGIDIETNSPRSMDRPF